jgi:superfamily II DNA or RNA helicase
MKVLDEGVDLPNAKHGILLASSENPRQYIQRRGRLLRKPSQTDKQFAYIYDLIVAPNYLGSSTSADAVTEIELGILIKEMARVVEFSKDSLNPREALDMKKRFRDDYGINL